MLTKNQICVIVSAATAWKVLRARLFPDWKDGDNWKFFGAGFVRRKMCCIDAENKRVFVNYDLPLDEIDITHILCHAVSGDMTHGPLWVDTMKLAAARVREQGGDWRSLEANADTGSWISGVDGDHASDPSVIDWDGPMYDLIFASPG